MLCHRRGGGSFQRAFSTKKPSPFWRGDTQTPIHRSKATPTVAAHPHRPVPGLLRPTCGRRPAASPRRAAAAPGPPTPLSHRLLVGAGAVLVAAARPGRGRAGPALGGLPLAVPFEAPAPRIAPAAAARIPPSSLPAPQTQFAALHMSTIHGPSTVVPVSGHPRRHSHEEHEFGGDRHMRAGKMCSQSSSLQGQMKPKGRSHSIQEFSEYFEQQLCIRTKRPVSLISFISSQKFTIGRSTQCAEGLPQFFFILHKYQWSTSLFLVFTSFLQEPEDRKERKDRESLRSRTRAHQEAGERRRSKEKEQEEANIAALTKKI
ncbi:leukemia NUP98 fusion partner 1 [Phascolarctos cinereus]